MQLKRVRLQWQALDNRISVVLLFSFEVCCVDIFYMSYNQHKNIKLKQKLKDLAVFLQGYLWLNYLGNELL